MAASTSTAPRELAPEKLKQPEQTRPWPQGTWHLALCLLTLAMLLVQGYHPLAEDGGLYIAGIEYLLNPTLFPHYTAFVTAHLHYSVFASSIAILTGATHLPLAWVLFLAYVFSLWLTLYAGHRILRRCFNDPAAQFTGVALLAAWATLPVAGTSLLLIDPYLTARNFSTLLSLLAIAFALDTWKPSTSITANRTHPITLPAILCVLCLLLAALFHPLMASYALAMVITLRLLRLQKPALPICMLAAAALAVVAILNYLAPSESPTTIAAAISRYYWFLSRWQWYELCGLLGPLCILLAVLISTPRRISPSIRALCIASITLGSLAIVIALLFAHEQSPTHLVARFQPLRGFVLIYALMTLLLGACLAQRLSRSLPRAGYPIIACALLINAGILFYVQRATFPASQHIEFPWTTPTNPWSRAFAWIRISTPNDALFALDANYITTSGEDAQTFRATAQRSSLPDFSKDGGEASITPTLGELWQQGARIQKNLSTQSDAERDSSLEPLGVTWIVLHANSVTTHTCPYNNGTVKVCSLTP